jgi:hypothetical protein
LNRLSGIEPSAAFREPEVPGLMAVARKTPGPREITSDTVSHGDPQRRMTVLLAVLRNGG